MTLTAARHCNSALNPLHSLIYFAPEAEREFTAIGLEPGGMAYLASRSAAMGAVGAGVVAATFYNFNPALIARHIPRAWQAAAPAAVLDARWRAVEAALRRVLGEDAADDPEVAEAAALATTATEACAAPGRPLYAAHADLDAPKAPQLALWHCAALLREHRGDGHIAALAGAGLDGIEALITHTATGQGMTREFACASRGWSRQEWTAGCERLRERGLLDADDALTPAGTALRHDIEETTDRLAADPYRHLGETGTARLTEIGARLTRTAVANGAFPAGVFATRG
ncbi:MULTISPECIES: SCO6745 family protein [unclassified Streptomyces]|uniref:SCO6745 family protein n=1 Tax=unclassified Streptomyces TaxID=2593676 RepID=UPI00344BDDAB